MFIRDSPKTTVFGNHASSLGGCSFTRGKHWPSRDQSRFCLTSLLRLPVLVRTHDCIDLVLQTTLCHWIIPSRPILNKLLQLPLNPLKSYCPASVAQVCIVKSNANPASGPLPKALLLLEDKGAGMVISDNLRGAIYMNLSMFAFTVNDTFMKELTQTLPLYQTCLLYTSRCV